MGLTTFFGLVAIGLLAVIVSKLNALQQEVRSLRAELARGAPDER
jgi:hypothetical protein